MAIGSATVALLLLAYYFVKSTSADQNLDLNYSSGVYPNKASVSTTMDIDAPIDVIWKALTNMSNYKLWHPWVYRLRVINENVNRWVHKHSLLQYQMEVGSFFKIQPFFGAPYNLCRFITIDREKRLAMEMRFFPFNKEIVTFSLTPYKNCVEISYTSTSNSLINFVTVFMFSWQGKLILRNFYKILPDLDFDDEAVGTATSAPEFVIDDNFITALIAKAYNEGEDILNGITEKVVRGKAKSGLLKAKRAGVVPEAASDALALVTQYLSGGPAPSASSVVAPVSDVPEEIRINQYILKGLDGDMDIINNIEDRVLRSKVKSGLTKAKRSGERPEIPADTAPIGSKPTSVPPPAAAPIEAVDEETMINTYVAKAVGGDEEAISSIKDRVLRSKVKSALVKAKRTGIVPEVPETSDQPPAPEIQDEASPAPAADLNSPESVVDQAVQAALEGNMDLINGIEDRVLRAKAKSALAKAKRAQG